jgi:hypothetical protein
MTDNVDFKSSLKMLRIRWLRSLFKKQYGFYPEKVTSVLGPPEEAYKRLCKENRLSIAIFKMKKLIKFEKKLNRHNDA